MEETVLSTSRWVGDRPVLRLNAVALADGCVAVRVEDRTEARRLDRVRQDFVANVGHELRTPVGALLLLAEQVVDRADDPEAVARYGERAVREATRLGRLVTEMVDLSRVQGAEPLPDPQPVALDDVVDEAVDRARTAADSRDIRLVVGGDRRVVVPGVPAQLVTAVANLVDNAVVYSPRDSQVTVAVRRRGDRADVTVSDSGVGIAAEDTARVFERFFRADRARARPDGSTGGNGLGLAIVKHVAENHGGAVDVWSAPGSGSTFTLRLPLDRAAAGAEAAAAPAGATG